MESEQFACGFCTDTFRSADEQKQHRKVVHHEVKRAGYCAVCKKLFPDYWTFYSHWNNAHPVQNRVVLRPEYANKQKQTPLLYKLFAKVEVEIAEDYSKEANLVSLLDKALANRERHHRPAVLRKRDSNVENASSISLDDDVIIEKAIIRNPSLPPYVAPSVVKQEPLARSQEDERLKEAHPEPPLPKRRTVDSICADLARKPEKRRSDGATSATATALVKDASPVDPFEFVDDDPPAPAGRHHVFMLQQQPAAPQTKKPDHAGAAARGVENAPPTAVAYPSLDSSASATKPAVAPATTSTRLSAAPAVSTPGAARVLSIAKPAVTPALARAATGPAAPVLPAAGVNVSTQASRPSTTTPANRPAGAAAPVVGTPAAAPRLPVASATSSGAAVTATTAPTSTPTTVGGAAAATGRTTGTSAYSAPGATSTSARPAAATAPLVALRATAGATSTPVAPGTTNTVRPAAPPSAALGATAAASLLGASSTTTTTARPAAPHTTASGSTRSAVLPPAVKSAAPLTLALGIGSAPAGAAPPRVPAASASSASSSATSGVSLASSSSASSSFARCLREVDLQGLQRAINRAADEAGRRYFEQHAVPMTGTGGAAAAIPATLSQVLQAAMPTAAGAAAAAAAAAAPPPLPPAPRPALLSVDAPYTAIIDKRYWTFATVARREGELAFPVNEDGVLCPRGCPAEKRPDSKQARAAHYKRNHPNVFYAGCQYNKHDKADEIFLAQHFGDANDTSRCCVYCIRERRLLPNHESRMALALHMEKRHLVRFMIIKQEYRKVKEDRPTNPESRELHRFLTRREKPQ